MIVRAALIPSAPLMLSQVTPQPDPALRVVRDAVQGWAQDLGDVDAVVLLAAGAPGAYLSARLDFAGIGRPDLRRDLPVPVRSARALLAAGFERRRGALPLDLAVLAGHLDRSVLPLAVDASASAAALAESGRALSAALANSRVALLAAGDGAAGLDEKAPLYAVDGAPEWQEAYCEALDDPAALAELGPGEAARVGARGWAPAVVLAAACAQEGRPLRLLARAAPRGVGYVVAGDA